ncbi:class I SAM-dependent methyltransferase [Dongia rigui]|uniref:SAM-dependent methyltransferase n=1 Tax=Dongia rigui TaxID=940149 RepID=A0ABU5DVM0_9PROT|nr:SAM-dependent methyltransferase [Dongia rigui]MDY0871361.1 SAM-dependent methyltransferase [Dongia rigui]
MHPALQSIRRRIALEGPLTLAAVMEEALAGRNGYYRDHDPLGPEGDFITAPEVSQMFGELIGLWCVDTWQRLGSPAAFNLVEMGPGRGTLMADALRAARVSAGFLAAKQLHLVEINAALRAKQAERLADHQPVWHEHLDGVPAGPMILVANELFDALPVHQLQMTAQGWRERVVALDGEHLQFGLAAPGAALGLLRPAHRTAHDGAIAEVSPASIALIDTIARRLVADAGAALIIDYGPAESGLGDSFQALKRHTYHLPLEALGEADLTAHVDFGALKAAAEEAGANVFGPTAQGDFLRALGIELRANMLAQKADAGTAEILHRQVHRLIAPEQMGRLFKALGLASPTLDTDRSGGLAGL